MPMASSPHPSRRGLLLLLLVGLLIWFGPLGYRDLVKPDEGRYAETAREMAVSGDWITPRLNGIKYFEKPPLQYWATAAAFNVFGTSDWVARLWTALTGFLTVIVVWWAGRQIFSPIAGLYAALVTASSFYFIGMGHVSTLDMGLAFFTTLALVGFCTAVQPGVTETVRRRAMLVTWAAMALAVLSKGLVGVVLPGATLALYMIFTRDWQLLRRLHLLPGLAVFFFIAAPWFIAVSLRNPEFAWFFFIHEHLLRYATSEARREGPIYYFVPILVIGFLPWLFVMLDVLWSVVRRPRSWTAAAGRPALALMIWSVFTFLFFSLSGSKLPSYILPIFPALALVIGRRLAELEPRRLMLRIGPVMLIALIGIYFVAQAAANADKPTLQPLYIRYSYWLYAAVAVTLAGAGWCCYYAWRGNRNTGLITLATAGLIAGQLAVCGHQSMAPTQSAAMLARTLRSRVDATTPFYSLKMYDYTLPFYLGRTLTLVDYRDEFSYGLDQQPALAVPSVDEFKSRWVRGGHAFALMSPDLYEELQAQGLAMKLVVNDGNRVVVEKPGEDK